MAELRTWIITLVTATILFTLIEKFAPQGTMNKYVRLACGLAMTVIIAIPVIQFLKGDFKLEAVAWNEYAKLSEGELKRRIERLQKEDSKQMIEVYRQSLIDDIKARFMGTDNFLIKSVDAVLYEDPQNESFGMIRKLYLTIEPRKGSGNALTKSTVNGIESELTRVFSIDPEDIIIDTSTFNGGG